MGEKAAQVRSQVRSPPREPAPGLSLVPAGAALPGLVSGALPGEDVLPVLPALRGLLTLGGLQRGQVVAAGGWGLLCLALAAGPSAAGAWCAAVGWPAVGVRAAADIGVDPARLLLVAEPGAGWPQVVASLLDGCDLILLRPPDRPSAQLRRKLEATARRHGSVLLVAGEWEGAPARLRVVRKQWAGIGTGHGRLRARQVQVVAEGRGAGARPRSAWLWLPGPDGAVATAPDGMAGAPAGVAAVPGDGKAVVLDAMAADPRHGAQRFGQQLHDRDQRDRERPGPLPHDQEPDEQPVQVALAGSG
jgi:hypothetical protein